MSHRGQVDNCQATLPEGNALNFTTEPPKAPPPPPVAAMPAAAPAGDMGMIEFDLGALSLDLGSPPAAAPVAATATATATKAATIELHAEDSALSTGGFEDTGGGDPLATKLALAQEFNAIGDPDGARSLAQEVLAEASGDLKSKAQRFLAEIS